MLNEALCLTERGNDSAAFRAWEKLRAAISDPEEMCICLLNESRCLRALGQEQAAEQRLQSLEKIDTTKNFRLHVERARTDALYRRKLYKQANENTRRFLEEYQSAKTDPRNADLFYEAKLALGFGLVNANDLEEGIRVLSEALPHTKGKDGRRVMYFRGLAYRGLKRTAEAINDLQKVVESGERDQLSADAHYDLGMIFQSNESFERAKENLQAAETLKDFITIPLRYLYSSLAHVCLALGDLEETKRYSRLADSSPRPE